ncbi:LamG domain-containing protein [Leptospira ilyithenensis]|uniref:LamG domain-containing protein n=1 Tax=Leptospira ilyithenensis TaxID=2484901 RepID=A0A4R9LS74_9LEPT|nr:LamG domain-containing protein [Leptospira ilyithenensis]
MDNTTCAISGTPTGTQGATTHIITAANDHGSGQAAVSITVTVPLQPLLQLDFTNGSLVNSGSVVISLGSPEASPVLTVGKDGDANGGYLYNANNQYFSASDTGLPMGASPRTMCAWINPSALPANGFYHMVLRYGNTTGANASVLAISTQASAPKISFIGSAYDAHADYTMPINTWLHLCSTFSGGTTVSFYVNGVFIASPTFVGTGPLNTISSSLVIGTWTGSGGTAYYWRGVLDDVRIYGVALSDTQIGRIYSIGATY